MWFPNVKYAIKKLNSGYCVAGTVGHKILNGTRKLEFKKGKPVEVKMSVQVSNQHLFMMNSFGCEKNNLDNHG